MNTLYVVDAEKLRIAAALIAECDLDLVETNARMAAIGADIADASYLNPSTLAAVAHAAKPIQRLMRREFPNEDQ